MASIKKFNGTTWDDTKVRKLGTSTDTITALPAVLYPNDTTATVVLKGQAVQSTTPTPQNPIIPQGTGERTNNLFDKTDILSSYEIVNN